MPDVERTMTVKITDQANAALREAARRERLSDVDIVNRALIVYDHIMRHQMVYGDVILRFRDGSTRKLEIK